MARAVAAPDATIIIDRVSVHAGWRFAACRGEWFGRNLVPPTGLTGSAAMPRFAAAVSLLLLGFSAQSAMAGIIVSSTQTRLSDHHTDPVTAYIEADRFTLALPEMTVIYRADLNRLWAADMARHVYYEFTPDTMRQFGGITAELNAAQSQLKDTISQLPPDQRAQIENLLGSIGAAPPAPASEPAEPVFAKLGSGRNVAGYACDLYRKSLNGQRQADFCISPVTSAGFSAADFQVFDRFSQFAAPLMSSHLVPHVDDLDWGGMHRALGFSGIPLDVVAYERGRPDLEETVTKVVRASIPEGTFDLPGGLTKQTIGMVQ